MPKFSVIISVYNKASHIRETIESVLDQTINDYEIIIVNDASTDHSDTIITSYISNTIKYIHLPENLGAGGARNKGIEQATGTYIALLDGDDLWKPNYLEEISLLIKKFPKHRVFATKLLRESKNNIDVCQYSVDFLNKEKHLDLNFFESSYKKCILHSSSTTLHKDVFSKVGLYDASIKSGQDTDLWIRVGLHYKVAFSTEALVTYRYAAHSLYKSINSIKDRLDLNKFLKEEKSNPAVKKYIDLNRYSLILRARLWGEKHLTKKHLELLDKNNLNRRQKWLLSLPTSMLKMAFKTQGGLEKLGVRLSSF